MGLNVVKILFLCRLLMGRKWIAGISELDNPSKIDGWENSALKYQAWSGEYQWGHFDSTQDERHKAEMCSKISHFPPKVQSSYSYTSWKVYLSMSENEIQYILFFV